MSLALCSNELLLCGSGSFLLGKIIYVDFQFSVWYDLLIEE